MNIAHNKPSLGIEEQSAAAKVIASGWLAQGKEVESFENEMCSFLGLPSGHAVAVSSGSSAIFMALKVLGAYGKRVALPAYSCSALNNAVSMCGEQAVFIDTLPGSPNLDLESLKRAGAGLAITPHMFGLPIDLSDTGDVEIIEDCAQALGATVNGTAVGLQGKIGVFSFYATKVITSGGQGGMVVSRDRSLVDEVRDYRDFDLRNDRKCRFNFQMSDLQAAIGRIQLSKLPVFLARREEIFQRYTTSGLDLLSIEGTGLVPTRFRAVMKTRSPQTIIAALRAKGIRAIVPIEDWELLDSPESFPNALRLTKETVSLPIYPTLSDKEVEAIIATVTTP